MCASTVCACVHTSVFLKESWQAQDCKQGCWKWAGANRMGGRNKAVLIVSAILRCATGRGECHRGEMETECERRLRKVSWGVGPVDIKSG